MRLPSDLVYTMRRYTTKDRRPKIGGCETGREGELYMYNLLCPGKSIAHYFLGFKGYPKESGYTHMDADVEVKNGA